eukprot:Opistho-2@95085
MALADKEGEEGLEGLGDGAFMFEEPEGFRPATPPITSHVFVRGRHAQAGPAPIDSPGELNIQLVGHHSLWAHCLWNAGVYVAHLLDKEPERVLGKSVVELGAAAALPSLVSALNGARKVVITDYPEASLIDNIQRNVDVNLDGHRNRVVVQGYLWGAGVADLLAANNGEKFDLVLLCDLVFNHSQHTKLLQSAHACLADGGKVIVAFTHHRPWLADKDMAFLTLAEQEPFCFLVRRMFEDRMDPMFPNDPGDRDVRATVHG